MEGIAPKAPTLFSKAMASAADYSEYHVVDHPSRWPPGVSAASETAHMGHAAGHLRTSDLVEPIRQHPRRAPQPASAHLDGRLSSVDSEVDDAFVNALDRDTDTSLSLEKEIEDELRQVSLVAFLFLLV